MSCRIAKRLSGAVAGTAAAVALASLVSLAAQARAETGIMSHYSALSVTASGRSYSSGDYVAAHKTLPLGTIVRVENTRNGRSATVRIVDRGPYIAGRILDVTPGVANALGFNGLAPSRVTVVGRGGSTGPYDRGGSARGSSSSDDVKPRRARAVRSASVDYAPQARRRSAAPRHTGGGHHEGS